MKNDSSDFLQKLREVLDPELLDYLAEDGSGLIDHPLIRKLVTNLGDAESANKEYNTKLDLREQAIESRDWFKYVQIHQRAYRLDVFNELKSDLSNSSYWQLLAWIWIDTEFPYEHQSEWKDLWGSNRSEKQLAMDPEERNALVLLVDEITVYRGVGKGDNVQGLSWTLNREQALWYARRFTRRLGGGGLLTGVAKKKDVHAFFTGRKEQEIVVERVSIISRETVSNGDNG